ncbi:MAG: sigma-70 family RNA polymerase sigma factor [Pseudomonadota bacterium]
MSAMAAAIHSDESIDRTEPTEAMLVERAKGGDRRSFEALYRSHASRVYALCWRLCAGDEALAADMVQESFLRAWQKLELFRGDAAFGTWLHRLVVNFVLSEKRKQIRRRDLEQPLDEVQENRQAAPRAPAGLDQDLEAVIARLPERARTVLILHDVEGYQHNEIAALADMAVGTSKAQLHRARKLLREWLGHERS